MTPTPTTSLQAYFTATHHPRPPPLPPPPHKNFDHTPGSWICWQGIFIHENGILDSDWQAVRRCCTIIVILGRNFRCFIETVKLQGQFFSHNCNEVFRNNCIAIVQKKLQPGYTVCWQPLLTKIARISGVSIFCYFQKISCITSASHATHRNFYVRRQCNNFLKLHCHPEQEIASVAMALLIIVTKFKVFYRNCY